MVRDIKTDTFNWSIVRPSSIWGPWFKYSYKVFFKTIYKGYYFHIGKRVIIKPNSFVGNTVYMMTCILFGKEEVNQKTFYIADYPFITTREWADMIQFKLGTKKIRTLPVWLLRIIGYAGDILKVFGYEDPPFSSFRLKNMLTGGIYPLDNTKALCGTLPYTLEEGAAQTIAWMKEAGDI